MKTIIDAVNEFKGNIKNAPSCNRPKVYIYESVVNNSLWRKGYLVADDDNYSDEEFRILCHVTEFNKCVIECETNFGQCDQSYSDYILDFNSGDKVSCYVCHISAFPSQQYCGSCGHELLSELIPLQDKPTFTQEMTDNGELPSVGMECLIRNSCDAHPQWQQGVIDYVGVLCVYHYVGKNERCDDANNLHFKPLTPPVTLVDGTAYQFESRTNKTYCGIYNADRDILSIQQGHYFDAITVSNIQLLTVEVES